MIASIISEPITLWIHDEAAGRATIYDVEVEGPTEEGRCVAPEPEPDVAAAAWTVRAE